MGGSDRPVVRVICGPTAAGKTWASLHLARSADVGIISADSRQLYRGFDTGTAKPSIDARRTVEHHGIDVLDPTERASAAWWAQQADRWIAGVVAVGRIPLVVGGTGLYLRALFGGLFDEPPMDGARRAALQTDLATRSTGELQRWVAELDPARAALGRTQLMRAIEVALLTGRRVSELHEEHRPMPRWRARYLVVDPGVALGPRIVERTGQMFADGWGAEVRALMERIPADAPAWNASGYRTVRELEQGLITQHAAEERVIIETRQYAKRQRTWFRHQLVGEDVTRVDPAAGDAERQLADWWANTGRTP